MENIMENLPLPNVRDVTKHSTFPEDSEEELFFLKATNPSSSPGQQLRICLADYPSEQIASKLIRMCATDIDTPDFEDLFTDFGPTYSHPQDWVGEKFLHPF
jgi:hypothetical protein